MPRQAKDKSWLIAGAYPPGGVTPRFRCNVITLRVLKCHLTGGGFFALATARRKAIYLELHPETAKEAFKGNQHVAADNLSVASFAAETAKAIGKDERTVRRDAERGEKSSWKPNSVGPEKTAGLQRHALDGELCDAIKAGVYWTPPDHPEGRESGE